MDHYPENTLDALRSCAPHVDMVEIDVQRCASGEVVVFHDETLDRLTDRSGPVSEHTLDELSSMTIGESTETVPTLREVLDALPDGTGINVELKHPGMVDDVAPLLRDRDREVVVSSFSADALAAFEDEPIPTAYLFKRWFARGLRTAERLGCAYVHPYYAIATDRAIDRAHERGLGVNAWTVRTEADVRRLRGNGVDGVIVDSWTVVPD